MNIKTINCLLAYKVVGLSALTRALNMSPLY